ncbi:MULTISPECIES: DcrB-related protein [unclassified Providencia]|uniref:DcrB-related protein n=1 Tax=Providencia stuartii TaxID=588 RepID=A0AAI9I1B5_PROST|nr:MULTISPECIES: DcrB-related protein [unclassified Providencia]ELR5036405.1 DcrB-related protein [Providencia stuartii]
MNYLFQEGSITLPSDNYQDNTVNMLRFPALQGSISITRDALSPEIELSDYLAGQLTAIKREMKNAVVKEPTAFTTEQNITGCEIYCETKQKGISIYQWIAAFRVEDKVLVLTYSQIKPFSNAEHIQWCSLRNSFTPHSR